MMDTAGNRPKWSGWRGGGALLIVLLASSVLLRLAGNRQPGIRPAPSPAPPPVPVARLGRAPDRSVVLRLTGRHKFDAAVQLRRRGNRLDRLTTVRVPADGLVRFPPGSRWERGVDVIGLERTGCLAAWDERWDWADGDVGTWSPRGPVRLDVVFQLPETLAKSLRARVDVLDESGASVPWSRSAGLSATESSGVMALDGLPAGAAIRLRGIDTRLAQASSLERIPVGSDPFRRTPRIRLELGTRLQGTVRGPDSTPLKGVQVCLSRATTWGNDVNVKTDRNGRFSFLGIPRGTYRLAFVVPERAGRMLGVCPALVPIPESGRELDIGTLVAQPAGRVAGTIRLRRGGQGIAGMQVRIGSRDYPGDWTEEFLTNGDGRFTAMMPPGGILMEARPVGGVPFPGTGLRVEPKAASVAVGKSTHVELWVGSGLR